MYKLGKRTIILMIGFEDLYVVRNYVRILSG